MTKTPQKKLSGFSSRIYHPYQWRLYVSDLRSSWQDQSGTSADYLAGTINSWRESWTGSYIKLPTPTGGGGWDTSQFSTDEWSDYTRPLTLNQWNYSLSNPVNYTDPSGLCTDCYVFFFPGAGNQGDIDDQFGGRRDNNLDDNLGEGEREMVRELRRRTGAIVIAVYPYGWGLRGNNVDKPLGTIRFG